MQDLCNTPRVALLIEECKRSFNIDAGLDLLLCSKIMKDT